MKPAIPHTAWGRFPWRRVRHRRVAALCLLFCGALHAADEPAVAWPEGLHTFDVAQHVVLNGMPMRMTGFISDGPPGETLRRFRQAWGEPLVLDRVGHRLVLGRAVRGTDGAAYYLSVQIEPDGQGSRGVVALAHLTAAGRHQEPTRAARERWAARLPAGTQILQSLSSRDGQQVSEHLLARNGHAPELNAQRLIELLAQDGFALERRAAAADAALAAGDERPAQEGYTLFFRGTGREAIAVLSRDARGGTSIVLNTVTHMQAYR